MRIKISVFKLFYLIIPVCFLLLWNLLGVNSEIEGLLFEHPPKIDSAVYAKVPAGKFLLAGTEFFVSEFYISKTEITVNDYFKVIGKNPTKYADASTFPVVNVSWNEAAAYCNALSLLQDLEPVYEIDKSGVVRSFDLSNSGYRLPTKNEWYFAAISAGISSQDATNGVDYIDKVAWFYYNSDHIAHPVAQKAPNALGIYDMRGNVSEWCNDDMWDWRETKSLNLKKDFCYATGKVNAPKAICGGFYDNSARKLDFVECQDLSVANGRNVLYGFRIARTLK